MVIRLKYSDDDYRLPVMFWYYSSNSKPFLTAIKKQTAEFLFHLWPKKITVFIFLLSMKILKWDQI